MSRKTAIIFVAFAVAILTALTLLAANSPIDPNAKHGPMEIYGMGPELFCERAIAWVKGISSIIKEAISELGLTLAAVLLFIQNYRKGRQLDEKIDDTKKEMAQRLSAQGQRIHQMAMAQDPSAMPVEELKEPTIMTPAPGGPTS